MLHLYEQGEANASSEVRWQLLRLNITCEVRSVRSCDSEGLHDVPARSRAGERGEGVHDEGELGCQDGGNAVTRTASYSGVSLSPLVRFFDGPTQSAQWQLQELLPVVSCKGTRRAIPDV